MFVVYVDRIRDGSQVDLNEVSSPAFLDIDNDPEIRPSQDVSFSGNAYIADDWLIIQGSIETTLMMRCAMCSELFEFPVHITDWMHEEPIENCTSGTFSYEQLIRESVLLEAPFYALCGGKVCLHREEVSVYLSKASSETTSDVFEGGKKSKTELEYIRSIQENGYQPFKELKWKDEK